MGTPSVHGSPLVFNLGYTQNSPDSNQKHKKLSRLTCACGHFLLFRDQRDRRVPHDGLLTGEGAQDSSTYQSTNLPRLSTLYEALSKQLISVLALCAQVSVTAMRAAGVAAQDGQKKGRRVRALSTQRRRCSC